MPNDEMLGDEMRGDEMRGDEMHGDENTVSVRVLRWAVGFYPPGKRPWGEAVLAESYEVIGVGAKLSWTIGGLNMAFREFLSNVFKPNQKPGLGGAGLQGPALPLPWRRVLGSLALAAVFLLAPGFREGLRLVVNSWGGYRDFDATSRRALARQAEETGDAESMAYAAMLLPFDEGVPMVKRAVAKDPTLTWAYYFVCPWISPATGTDRTRRLELLAAVSKWDPDNAVPYLAIAVNTSSQGDAYKDPQWLDAMNHALTAKNYDSYFVRRLELQRRLNHAPDVSNTIDNLISYRLEMPWISTMNAYAAFLQQEGESASSQDKREEAARQLWALANLGSLIHVKALTFGEKFGASQMQEVTFAHLQPLLTEMGRTQEAQAVGYAASLEAEQRAGSMPRGVLDDPFVSAAAVTAHLLVMLMIACVLLLAASGLLFAIRGTTPRFVRLVFDYAPLVLVAGCVAFLGASYPYAQAAKAFVNNPFDGDAILHVFSLSFNGEFYINWFLFPKALYFWLSMIGLGTLICLWIGSRGLRRTTI